MSAIINGDSPSVTFSDGTTQATSAIVSGKVPYTNLPAGSVLQAVNSVSYSTSGVSTTSGPYVTTGISVSITPKYSTSKILVLVNGSSYIPSGTNGRYTIYRNSTNLATGTDQSSLMAQYSSGSNTIIPVTMSYLDSPATTSSTTYTIYFATSGSAIQFLFSPGSSGSAGGVLTVLEIAA